MRRSMSGLIALLVAAATLALSGCACGGPGVEIIDMQTASISIPGNAERSALIEIDLGIGELSIAGGSSKLLSGEIKYNIAEWKPVVEHRSENGDAFVRVAQPGLGTRSIGDKARTHWALEVSDDIPSHLVIDVGVGESRIDLADAMVERVDIDAGVGDVVVDVTDVRRDLLVSIDNGVGTVTIHVPGDVGVRVECDRGIGSFTSSGLTRSNGGYVNAAYGDGGALISIQIDSGVGEVTIITGSMTASI